MKDELYSMARRPAGSIHPGASVTRASEAMMSEGVGALVVVDEGRLIGILSERDIVGRVVARRLDPAKTLVSEVMTREVATARPGMTATQAMDLMHKKRFRHLPLVDESGKVVGMLSVRHLLQHRVEELDRSTSDIVAYFSADGPGGD